MKLREAKPSIIAAKKFPKVTLTVKPNEITLTQIDGKDSSNIVKMTPSQFNLMLQKYQEAMK